MNHAGQVNVEGTRQGSNACKAAPEVHTIWSIPCYDKQAAIACHDRLKLPVLLACRHSEYQLLSRTWSVRPNVPVSAAPAAWWKHACAAVLAECRQRRPPGSMRQALARRRQYIALYLAVHSSSSGYVRSVGQRKLSAGMSCEFRFTAMLLIHAVRFSAMRACQLSQFVAGLPQLCPCCLTLCMLSDVWCCLLLLVDAAALQALHTAEATMTVCEIVTHRIFVGLQHSRHLLRRPALWQHWLEVLDGLGGFVDLVPGRGPGQQASKPGEHDWTQMFP